MVEAGQLDPVVDVHPRAGPVRQQPAPGRQPLRVNAVLRGADQHRVVRQRAPGGGDSPGAGAFPAAGRAAQQHAAAVERQQRSVQDQQLPPQQQREEAVPDDALQCVELPQQRLIPGFVQEYLHPVRRSHPGREPVCPENRPGRGGSEFLPFRERPAADRHLRRNRRSRCDGGGLDQPPQRLQARDRDIALKAPDNAAAVRQLYFKTAFCFHFISSKSKSGASSSCSFRQTKEARPPEFRQRAVGTHQGAYPHPRQSGNS